MMCDEGKLSGVKKYVPANQRDLISLLFRHLSFSNPDSGDGGF